MAPNLLPQPLISYFSSIQFNLVRRHKMTSRIRDPLGLSVFAYCHAASRSGKVHVLSQAQVCDVYLANMNFGGLNFNSLYGALGMHYC